MNLILIAWLVSTPQDSAETLRARAALAWSFAEAELPPRLPPYAEQYPRAVAQRVPLIVWVGQPARPLAGCFATECTTFPNVHPPAVVLGIPHAAGLLRVDLPGTPSDEQIQSRLASTPPLPR
jgi:hypothetical protein